MDRTQFIQHLSRLFPAPQRDDADFAQQNNQFNFNNLNPLEAARRVAFALNAGIHAQGEQALEPALIEVTGRTPAPEPEMSPQAACRWGAPDQPNPSPEPEGLDPARERWAADLSLTPEQRAANALVRDTIECDITNYHGSAAEQPDASVPRPAPRQPSAGERRRAVMSRRGSELL